MSRHGCTSEAAGIVTRMCVTDSGRRAGRLGASVVREQSGLLMDAPGKGVRMRAECGPVRRLACHESGVSQPGFC